jgi:hypothetical protein
MKNKRLNFNFLFNLELKIINWGLSGRMQQAILLGI